MIKTYFINFRKLPLVVEPNSKSKSVPALTELACEKRDFFTGCLLQYGALLLRGFEAQTINEFENFVRCFSGKNFFNYAGGVSPRQALSKGVYTSTEYPPHLTLALHNELSYSEKFPHHLYFFCQTEPQRGGATTLGDSRRILRNLSPKTVGLFKHRRVRYDRSLISGKDSEYSWQTAFETEDRTTVENHCRLTGISFEWQAAGNLRLSQIRPATAVHPETGEEVWFNQADGFHPSNLDTETYQWFVSKNEAPRLDSRFGDGSSICLETLEQIRSVSRRESVPHYWQKGDILILDNILTAHGRQPFSGARKIALAMT